LELVEGVCSVVASPERWSGGVSSVVVVCGLLWASGASESAALLYDGLWAEGVEQSVWGESC
jgi:hypothetical protein